VAIVLLGVFPLTPGQQARRRLRPLAALRLIGHVAVQLVVSNAVMTREILTRRPSIRTAIVACRLRSGSETTMTVVSSIIALSPGMMVVDVSSDTATIYVHVLHFRDVIDTRRRIAHLEMLVLRAIGTDGELRRPLGAGGGATT
jgi:multisubunit Na+/H+ antiporter MnhE subunit